MAEEVRETVCEGEGVWEHFVLQDGLPDMKIEAIFEDSRGALWIGTHDGGVARYEGQGFEVYTRRDGLSGNGVFSILEDQKGDLWFGTDQGLTRYDGSRFCRVGEKERPDSFLWGSCVDHEGNLWFGLEGKPGRPPAACRWDGKKLETVYLAKTAKPQGQSVHRIAVDPQGGIWFGGQGLYYYHKGQFHCIKDYPSILGQITCLLVRNNATLWIASDNAVFTYNHKAGIVKLLNDRYIDALIEDKSGVVWGATYDGRLIRWDGTKFKILRQLEACLWGSFRSDRIGRLWIGTYGMGLYCYDPTRLRLYRTEQGLPANSVRCLAEDSEGRLWIGTRRGLACFDGRSMQVLNDDERLEKSEITALLLDQKNRLWIGTRSAYLFVYENDSLHLCSLVEEMKGFSLTDLAEGKDGRIWFCSRYGKGFGFYQEGEAVYFAPGAKEDYPAWVGALEVDQAGRVWLGSASPSAWDGLCRFDGRRFERIEGISGSSVRVILEDRAGRLWIGTNEGLVCREGEKTSIFTREHGLSCEIITALAEAQDGTLLIGTDGGGVCWYDGSVFQVVQVPGDPACNVIRAIHQDRDGRFWFGTEGGLVQFVPRQFVPRVEIEKVVADKTYAGMARVQVPSAVNRVRFCFKGWSPGGRTTSLVYRFRLYGGEDRWQQSRSQEVEYTQLKPGRYRFVVQGIDSDLNYSEIADVELIIAEDPWIALLEEMPGLESGRLYRGNSSILIADRDPSFAMNCKRLLEGMGYRVQVAEDTDQGLQVNGTLPCDLVLLDIASARGAEMELLARIRMAKNSPEVIVLADYTSRETAARMIRLGARAYLTKPFEGRQLLAEIQRVLSLKKDPLVKYLCTHVNQIHSREQVAEHFQISPGTVGNWIARATGLTFSDFLQACRLEEARRLLIHTGLDIQQIAARVGMRHDVLARLFRRRYNCSPQQFRRDSRMLTV